MLNRDVRSNSSACLACINILWRDNWLSLERATQRRWYLSEALDFHFPVDSKIESAAHPPWPSSLTGILSECHPSRRRRTLLPVSDKQLGLCGTWWKLKALLEAKKAMTDTGSVSDHNRNSGMDTRRTSYSSIATMDRQVSIWNLHFQRKQFSQFKPRMALVSHSSSRSLSSLRAEPFFFPCFQLVEVLALRLPEVWTVSLNPPLNCEATYCARLPRSSYSSGTKLPGVKWSIC